MNGSTVRSRKKSKDNSKELKMRTQQSKICGIGKATVRGKFIALWAYLKKLEKEQINNLTLHLKEHEKEQQTKPKVNRRKDIIKIRAEINEIESNKLCKRSMNPRAGTLKR